MENIVSIGKTIKDKRLALNMRICDLAKEAGISRASLSSIENGKGNYSINVLLKLFEVLGISFVLNDCFPDALERERAARLNTIDDKKINSFIVMCVEQYASYKQKKSREVYRDMLKKHVIKELKEDYEDLHGMSFEYLNDFFDSLLKGENE